MSQKNVQNAAVGQSVSKFEVVANMLKANASMSPQEIVESCKAQNIEITKGMASNYKSKILHGDTPKTNSNQGGNRRGRPGQQQVNGNGRGRRQTNVASIATDLETLRGIAQRYGKDEASRMLQVVGG